MLLTFRIIEVEIFSLVIWGYLSTVRFLVSLLSLQRLIVMLCELLKIIH